MRRWRDFREQAWLFDVRNLDFRGRKIPQPAPVDLASYNDYETEAKSIDWIVRCDSEDLELQVAAGNILRAYYDRFIMTASDYGLRRYEAILNLDSDGTMEERRRRVFIAWNRQIVYTHRSLEAMLSVILGDGNFKINLSYNEYEVEFIVRVTAPLDLVTLSKELRLITPANLGLHVRLVYERYIVIETREDHMTYPIFLCGERKCGTIPEDKFIGTRHTTALGIKIGLGQHRDYYGYTNGGHRAGELRADKEEEIIYMQDLKSDTAFTFTEDDHD